MSLRRGLRRDEKTSTRDLIIEITERLIVEKGMDSWRLQDIAKELGIQVPSIYAHFKGRNDIIEAIVEQHIQAELKFPYSIKELGSPKDAIINGVKTSIDYYINNPARLILVVLDYATPGGIPGFRKVDGAGYDDLLHMSRVSPMYKSIEDVLVAGYKSGQFREISLLHFINTMFGALAMNLMFPANVRYLPDMDEAMKSTVRARVLDVLEKVVFVQPQITRENKSGNNSKSMELL